MNDAVKWTIKDKQLTIKFQSPDKNMIGEVIHTNFDLIDSELAIFDTSKLDKLLAITSGDLNLQLEKVGNIYGKLIIEDVSYKLKYSTAEMLLIKTPQRVNDTNDYTIKSVLDSESISAIIKAKNAIQSDRNIVKFTITKNFDDEQVLTMIFGDSDFSNKVEYIVPNTVITGEHYDFNIPFNSEMIRVICANNRDADTATMSLNLNGMIKFEFSKDNWKSTYYVVRLTKREDQ